MIPRPARSLLTFLTLGVLLALSPYTPAQNKGKADKAPKHWSFAPVQRPKVPQVKDAGWVQTPIDAFVLAELEKNGLKPAKPADRRTLLRRVFFDLIGLPPTPEEVERFLADRSPDAYRKVVEGL